MKAIFQESFEQWFLQNRMDSSNIIMLIRKITTGGSTSPSYKTFRIPQGKQWRSSLNRVYTVCLSICTFCTNFSMETPLCLNFRVITANSLGVRKFWAFTTLSPFSKIFHSPFFCCDGGRAAFSSAFLSLPGQAHILTSTARRPST